MPRRVQDIVPTTKKSAKEVPLPIRRIHEEDEDVDMVDEHEPPQEPPEEPPKQPKKKHKKRPPGALWKALAVVLGILVVISGLGYIATTYFARAVFNITPRSIPVSVSGTYTATATPQPGSLLYDIARVNGSASTTVPSVDGPHLETKATGSVTFYNNYSKTPWRLIAGTRLSADNGKIYRLTSSISIPGSGTVAASVVADQAGDAYNVGRDAAGTLSVVAYSGSTKETTIYAKAASDIRGGFVGNKKTVDPKVLDTARTELQARITSYLRDEIKGVLPAGEILFDPAIITTFSEPEVADNGKGSALVTVSGTMYGVLFKQDDLVAKLAGGATVDSFAGKPFKTDGIDKLAISLSNSKDFSPVKKNTLIMKFRGDLKLTGIVPIAELKQKFAGISLSGTQSIMQSYAPIIDLEKSTGQVVPPWSKIPTNPDKISVIVNQ